MQDEEVHLVPHNPLWYEKFKKEKKLILQTLKQQITGNIQHVGSTAIPDISAKPIIDIMVGVTNLEKAKECIPLLEKIGYLYFPYKKNIMMWFCKPSITHREFHLYLIEENSKEWEARILFRDYLTNSTNTRKQYAQLKQELANKFKSDREAYTRAKENFVKKVVEKAKLAKANQP